MEIKYYSQYKKSSKKWFENIPTDWEIHKLKFLISSIESGKRKDFENENYAFSLGGEHINWNGTLNLNNERYLSKEYYNSMNSGKIQKNDVLLVKDGATIGKTAIIEELSQKMAVNEHVFIIRKNKKILPKLLYYLISSNLGFTQIKLTETGSAQPGINLSISDIIYFTIPNNKEEQKEIAKYLDHKTSQIEENITKNKKLIELLKEKRTSLINQAVTKGLNPEAPMKESGIEWIGKIPEHWKNSQLRAYFIEHKNKNKSLKETNLLSLSYGKIIRKDINTKEGLLPENFENYNVIKKNYIVLRLTDLQNDKRSLRTGLCTEKGIITSAYVTIRPFKKINTSYVHYLLHSYDINKIFYNMGAGVRQNMNFQEFSRLPLLIPDITEQKEIVEYLDNKTQLIDKTVDKIEKDIELLEEYKESLIHHVVTGKIDVRGVEV